MEQARPVRSVAAFALAGALCAPAPAGPVELELVLFEVDYGVLADGGGGLTPLQGPVQVGEGEHDFAWSQVDGVAFAEATASAALVIHEGGTFLGVGGSLETTASAAVGDDPGYPFESGIAEAFVGQVLLSISVEEQSVLSVTLAPVDLVGYGTIEPGNEQILEPGLYDLWYPGGFATGSMVSVGANEEAFDENAWSFGVEVAVVPAPGGVVCLLMALGLVRRRR